MCRFTSPVITGFLIFTFLGVGGCSSNYQKIASQPVARIGQHQLTVKEFSDQLARKLKYLDSLSAKNPNNIKRIKNEVLNDFILSGLMADWASSQKISISDDETNKITGSIRSNYPDDLSFRRYLAEEGISFSQWHQLIKNDLVLKMVFKKLGENIKQPSEEEMKKYYQENTSLFKIKDRILISQILVTEQAVAEQIQKDLKNKSFTDLAKKYSIAPEGRSGGNMGWIEKGSVDFIDPLFLSPPGLVNKLIRSHFGIHIFKIEKKQASMLKPFEEVKGQIKRTLYATKEQAEFLRWFDKQLRDHKIYKDTELINSITIATKDEHE